MRNRISKTNRRNSSVSLRLFFVLAIMFSFFSIFHTSSAQAGDIELAIDVENSFDRAVSSGTVCPGDILTYNVSMENNSSEIAEDVTLYDLLPSGTYTSDTVIDNAVRATGFAMGSFSNVVLNATNRISFASQSEQLSGSFESRIIDGGADRFWSGLAWATTSPSGKSLPDGGNSDKRFDSGLVSLSDNILLFHCDENNTKLRDASGSGNDGLFNGTASLDDGIFASALAFDGLDDFVVVDRVNMVDFNAGLTISAWVNAFTVSQGRMSILEKRGSDGYSFSMSITEFGQVEVMCTDSQGRIMEIRSEEDLIVTGEWYHLAARLDYSGSSYSLYINGEQVEAETVVINPFGSDTRNSIGFEELPFYIGCSDNGFEKSSYFNGLIDEVAVLNNVSDEATVSALAHRGFSDVTFQVRVCDDGFCSGGGQFIGPDGTSQTYFSAASVRTPGFANVDLSSLQLVGRYIQYKAYFSRKDSVVTPELSQVFFRYDGGSVKIDKGACFGVTTIECQVDSLAADGDTAALVINVVTPEGNDLVVNEAASTARMESGAIIHNTTELESSVGMSQVISGFVYLDFNENEQIDASDWIFEDVTVTLTTAGLDGVFDTADDTLFYTQSDLSGQYSFSYLCGSEYRLSVEQSSIGGLFEAVSGGLLVDMQLLPGLEDIDVRLVGLHELDGKVWFDTDADGIHAASNEPGIPEIQITCQWSGIDSTFDTDDDKTISMLTDENGLVDFTRMPDGNYRVTAVTGDYELVSNHSSTKSNEYLVELPSNDSVLFGLQGTSSQEAIVWFDLENQGVRDTTEVVFANAPVTFTWSGPDSSFNTADDVTMTELTDATGNTSFSRLPAGLSTLSITTSTLPLYGLVATTASSKTLTIVAGSIGPKQEFGVKGNSLLGNKIWHDFDGDGLQDSVILQDAVTEPGLAGAQISLQWAGRDGNIETEADNYCFVTEKVTNISGAYSYSGLPGGYYKLSVTLPQDYTFTPKGMGNLTTIDSDVNQSTGLAMVYVAPCQYKIDIDAGAYKYSSVSGLVWEDRNSNGLQDDGLALSQMTVAIEGYDGTGIYIQDKTRTDANGQYSFANLIPGSYSVTVYKGVYNLYTTTDAGDETLDSDVSSDSGIINISSTSGDNHDIDAGLILFRPIDLQVKMRAQTQTCAAGEEFDVTIGVNNISSDYAYSITLVSLLPDNVTYVSGPSSVVYDATSNTLSRSIDKLAPSQSDTVTVRIRLNEDFSGDYTQRAMVRSISEDTNKANNRMSITIAGV